MCVLCPPPLQVVRRYLTILATSAMTQAKDTGAAGEALAAGYRVLLHGLPAKLLRWWPASLHLRVFDAAV